MSIYTDREKGRKETGKEGGRLWVKPKMHTHVSYLSGTEKQVDQNG